MTQAPGPQETIGIGVLGMGFMGRTHTRAYGAAIADGYPARLVALCDRSSAGFDQDGCPKQSLPGEDQTALFDPSQVEFLTDTSELFARRDIDLLSICTHTDSHVELAIAALEAGKNVLLEKPVALAARDVERLMQAANSAPGFCLPAMCMRFWPGWSWLKSAIQSNRYGMVRSAVFRRQCARPDWAPEFYADLARSGGALFDLHIHDADLILWLFGTPDEIHSSGDLNHVTCTYEYENGPAHVAAQGGWNHAPGFPFQMHYTIIFEQATAEFSSTRDPALLIYQDGKAQALEQSIEFNTGYEGEIRHALDLCAGAEPIATLEETLRLTQLLETQREALLAR